MQFYLILIINHPIILIININSNNISKMSITKALFEFLSTYIYHSERISRGLFTGVINMLLLAFSSKDSFHSGKRENDLPIALDFQPVFMVL